MALAEPPTQSARTRRKLFDRAAELFAARGYDAVSVREIVEACGVTKPALYYHYGNKEGLARAVISDFFDEASRLRTAALAKGDLREALLHYARGKIRLAQERRSTLAFTFSIWFGRSSLRAIFEDCRKRHEQTMQEWVSQLRRYGLGEDAAHRVLKAFWGLLMHRLIMILQCPKWSGDAEAEAGEIVAVVTGGALDPPRPARRRAGKAVALLLGLLMLLAGCKPPQTAQGQGVQEAPPRNVVVKTLEPEHLVVQLKMPGVTSPRETIELRAAASGEITELPYKEGEPVLASVSPYAIADLEKEHALPADKRTLHAFARINPTEAITAVEARTLTWRQALRDQKRVLDYKDSTEQQKERAQTDVDNAALALKAANKALRDTYVVSPLAGVLRKRLRQKGEFVSVGELIAIVDVLNPMVFTLDVPEAQIGRVARGDEHEIEFSALRDGGAPLKRQGKITLVDRVASPATHTFRVEMEVENGDGKVLAGVFGTLMLTTYEKKDALVVPFQAIKLEGEDEVAFVVVDGRAQRRAIVRGEMTANRFEIRGGLAAGETVVTVGAQNLNDGDKVVIRGDPTASQ